MEIFIHRDGRQFGPYSFHQAKEYLEAGNLLPTDLAWYEAADDWVQLDQIEGILPAPPPVTTEPAWIPPRRTDILFSPEPTPALASITASASLPKAASAPSTATVAPAPADSGPTSLLREYARENGSTEEGVKAFAADVTARYETAHPADGEKVITCRWVIEYESKTDLAAGVFMLPLLFLGLFHVARSKISFETHHAVTEREVKQLMWSNAMRKTLLPLAVLGVMGSGLLLAIFIVGLLCFGVSMIWSHAPRTVPAHPLPLIIGLVSLLVVFVASLSAQIYLRKAGRPPRTDDFADQHIKLQSVTVE